MRKLTRYVASLAIVGLAMAPLLRTSALAQESKSPLWQPTTAAASTSFRR